MMDAKAQGRANTRASLIKIDAVRSTLKLHPEGLTLQEISERTGLSDDDIRKVISRLRWGEEVETRYFHMGGRA